MRSINFFAKSVLTLSLWMISAVVVADEGHVMVMPSAQTELQPVASSSISDHVMHKMLTASPQSDSEALPHHDHAQEHGAQIYAATTVENKWLVDQQGNATLKSKLETRIGTDENKIFIKLHLDKDEAQDAEFDGKVLYSRMISDFWDAQLGIRYGNENIVLTDDVKATEEKLDGVLGLHGLAPYFFETDAYLYIGQDSFVGFSLETERDLLLSQKLIVKPYLELDLILNEAAKYAQKSGLDRAKVGLETRYEINKKVMPFIDLAYQYRQGREHTTGQDTEFLGKIASEKTWLYGAGLRFKF